MKKKEIRKAIKTVYSELWEMLALYEKTDGFNKVPAGEGDEDIWEYMGDRLLDVRKSVDMFFLGEEEISRELHQIINETEYFIRQYEIPGVSARWKEINPRLIYFDCSFMIMESDPELYKKISRGQTEVSLSTYPDEELIKEKKEYFKRIEEINERNNLRYSEERIFQNELHRTLKLLFKEAFQKYL